MRRWLLRFNAWLFALLIVLVIAGAGWLTTRYSISWQWGSSAAEELAEASRRLLDSVEGEVVAVAFVPPEHLLTRHVESLLTRYGEYKSDFSYRTVNPELRPDLVRALGVERVGEVVLQYGERRERVSVPTEARISAALERLLRGSSTHVAYLVGHGERDLLGEANHHLGRFGEALSRKGYRLQPMRPTAVAVPDNTALLVVSAPQTEWLPGVRQRIRDYVTRGGNLLILGEPGEVERLEFLDEVLPLRWREGVVEDPLAARTLQLDDPSMVLVDDYPDHPAVRSLDAPLLLPRAAALELMPGDWRAEPILRKDDSILGAALSRRYDGREQRVVAVGDGDFLSNAYIGNGANLPLGLNLVDWLSEAELFLDTYTRGARDQALDLGRAGLLVVGFGFLFGMPLLFLVLAASNWWRRRRG